MSTSMVLIVAPAFSHPLLCRIHLGVFLLLLLICRDTVALLSVAWNERLPDTYAPTGGHITVARQGG